MTTVDDVTGLPEMLDHRVKTLHPKIHGGILADRGKESHLADIETHGIEPFDLVVSNLYPFLEPPGIETIDIGGPAMVRARRRTTRGSRSSRPDAVRPVLDELRANDGTRRATARRSPRGLRHTAAYDAAIVAWLARRRDCCRATSSSRSKRTDDAALRREPAPAAARYRLARHHELVGR